MLIVQLREQFFFLLPIVSLFEKNHDSSSIMFLVFKNQLITKENNNLIDFLKDFSYLYFILYNFSIFNFPRVPRRDRPNRSGPGTSTGGTTGPVSVQGKYLSFKNSKFYKELYCVMFFQ